uniref:Sodefrin-like factor n=1 Tax=Panagrolaimus sp. PS1159 TaxID=55785 RepID=A0AC35FVZ0_9BILA
MANFFVVNKQNKTDNNEYCLYYKSNGLPPSKPQVQCAKSGYCLTGLTEIPSIVSPDVTCDACATFICNVNGKLMTGSGCLNDFERICKRVPEAKMQKIKAGKNFYNFINENNIVSSCTFADDCHAGFFTFFSATVLDKIDIIRAPILASKGEICPYDPQPPKPKDNGSNGYKLSGMFALGLILFYF